MEEGNQLSKLISEVDREFASPEERAEKVWKAIYPIVKDFSDWDMLCFCGNWIVLMSARWPFIKFPAVDLNKLIYSAHYQDRESDGDKRSNGNWTGGQSPDANRKDAENSSPE